MPQDVFTSGALVLARYCAGPDRQGFEAALKDMQSSYLRDYPNDDFADQWRTVAPRIWTLTASSSASPDARLGLLKSLFQISTEYGPDGKKRRTFLGFIGGTLFTKSHPCPQDRPELAVRDYATYLILHSRGVR